MALVALFIAATSVTLMSFGKKNKTSKLLAPTTVYFHGNPTNAAQVANESLWNTTPNNQECNGEPQLACSMEVEDSDLNASNQLDPAKIDLGSVATSSGYIPSKIGGSSTTPFNPTNRN